MLPTKNLVGHQRLQLTSQKPLLSLQHAVDNKLLDETRDEHYYILNK